MKRKKRLLTEGGKGIVMVISTFSARIFSVWRCKNVKHSTRADCSETMQIPTMFWVQYGRLTWSCQNFIYCQLCQPYCQRYRPLVCTYLHPIRTLKPIKQTLQPLTPILLFLYQTKAKQTKQQHAAELPSNFSESNCRDSSPHCQFQSVP